MFYLIKLYINPFPAVDKYICFREFVFSASRLAISLFPAATPSADPRYAHAHIRLLQHVHVHVHVQKYVHAHDYRKYSMVSLVLSSIFLINFQYCRCPHFILELYYTSIHCKYFGLGANCKYMWLKLGFPFYSIFNYF